MIQNNFIANNVFWGLKDNWWKQLYDGKYHKFGSAVFDKGLHDGNVEPGFYNSIKNASEYAAEQIGQPLTIECYKKVHQLACAHFPHVSPNQINVDKENINNFRNTNCSCSRNLVKHSYEYENEEQSNNRRLEFVLLHSVRWNLLSEDKIKTETGCKKELDKLIPLHIKERIVNQFTKTDYFSSKGIVIRDLLEKGNPFYEKAIESMEKVTEQLEASQKKLNLAKPFASLKINASGEETLVHIIYNYQNPIEIEEAIHKLINDYNEKLQKLPFNSFERNAEENELALNYIAELFQNLEWLHPFFDGQGRTDLILLAKLLTENGFNPSILYDPFYSTFEPLEKWISYLRDGIEAWKREKENI
ncbi:MAG: Fic family protein [Candidatus Protochlamydia sp.]|nr:Fic family protein [Candidatus Protochlamydia sp.]